MDQAFLATAYSRSFPVSSWTLTLGGKAGVEAVGNLGGSGLQDWAHRALFVGRHLDGTGENRLQYLYPRRVEVFPIVGVLAAMGHPLAGPLWLRTGLWAEGGAGTGALGEFHPFLALALSTRYLELEVRESGGIYGTSIPSLTMPGGYVTGRFEGQLSARLLVRSPRPLPFFLAIDEEWNRNDSHQHVAQVAIGAWF